ncbi:hypothetical protein Bateq7PJ16_0122 [Bacillus subtilis]|nr:hypothetical protein Bateq7PJ16_0122 [Bacillus subtilis]
MIAIDFFSGIININPSNMIDPIIQEKDKQTKNETPAGLV